MAAPVALICKVLFPSIYTFETLPNSRIQHASNLARDRAGIAAQLWTHTAPAPHWSHRTRVGQRSVVKEPRRSGLGHWRLAQRIGGIEHEGEGAAQELRQCP